METLDITRLIQSETIVSSSGSHPINNFIHVADDISIVNVINNAHHSIYQICPPFIIQIFYYLST